MQSDVDPRLDGDGRGRGHEAARRCLVGDPKDSCKSRTRLWQNGEVKLEGFPIADISEHIDNPGSLVWLDLESPTPDDLKVLVDEFSLHPLAIEDATTLHQRPKLDRYSDHLFLNFYTVRVNTDGTLKTSELSAFILPNGLVTVRKDSALRVERLLERWDATPQLLSSGAGALVYGMLDLTVDGHFAAVEELDDVVEDLEELVFSDKPLSVEDQRHSFDLRKSLTKMRRVVLPMREVVNTLMRQDLGIVDEQLMPYYQDIYDHVLRATEQTESLRDLISTIRETNLTLQGNRLNEIMKKLTSWAAIIAVPTAVTGFFGQNVPYPGFNKSSGFWASIVLMAVIAAVLYVLFRRRNWL